MGNWAGALGLALANNRLTASFVCEFGYGKKVKDLKDVLKLRQGFGNDHFLRPLLYDYVVLSYT